MSKRRELEFEENEKLKRDVAKLERDRKRLKGLKARVVALEAAQDEKEEALFPSLNEKGRQDIAKFKREGKLCSQSKNKFRLWRRMSWLKLKNWSMTLVVASRYVSFSC